MSTEQQTPDDASRRERFLDYLDELVGEAAESGEDQVESMTPGLPGVVAIDYEDAPEEGLLLGVTYGLSLASHESWTAARPELSICLESDDPEWALAIAELAEQFRGAEPFAVGDVFELGEPIVAGTRMDGFVIAGPLVLDDEAAHVQVGEDLPVRIVGVYPTYASERAFIREQGVEAFWKLDWDPYDPDRDPAV